MDLVGMVSGDTCPLPIFILGAVIISAYMWRRRGHDVDQAAAVLSEKLMVAQPAVSSMTPRAPLYPTRIPSSRFTPDGSCVGRVRAAQMWRTSVGSTGIQTDGGGLEYVQLEHDNGSTAKVFVFGGVPTSYVDSTGKEWIAVRPDAKMDGSKPISGGLSHCFPQFGPGEIQQHGFARNVEWNVDTVEPSRVVLSLSPSDYTRDMWDNQFSVKYEILLKADRLDTMLTVTNNGSESFSFQAALHSYLDISDIGSVSIAGSFKGVTGVDRMQDPSLEFVEDRDEITVAEPYDRIYKGVLDAILKDQGKGAILRLVNTGGFTDTVIWSPYGEENMGYRRFICVESAAIDHVNLASNDTWTAGLSLVPQAM